MEDKILVSFFDPDTNAPLGQLTEENSKLVFRGKTEESAERFFEFLCAKFNDRVLEIAAEQREEHYEEDFNNLFKEYLYRKEPTVGLNKKEAVSVIDILEDLYAQRKEKFKGEHFKILNRLKRWLKL